VMTGIAGGIDDQVSIGDVTVCSLWAEHDYLYVGNDTTLNRPIWTYRPLADSVEPVKYLPVDKELYELAGKVADDEIELLPVGDYHPRLLAGGVGVSGNAFIDSKGKRRELSSGFEAVVTDMESYAVVHVCTVNDIPVLVFRSASDLAGGSDRENAREQMNRFFAVAADNSATVLAEFLRLVSREY